MTTIKQLQHDFSRARALFVDGAIVPACRLMLMVQRLAKQSRSRHAPTLSADAHMYAAMGIKRYAGPSHDDKSELGRIAAESKHLFTA